MTLFDSLLAARDAIDAWLVENPEKNARRWPSVFAAREQLSQSMVALEGLGLHTPLRRLEAEMHRR